MCTCVHIFLTKWCILGYLSNALLYLWDWSLMSSSGWKEYIIDINHKTHLHPIYPPSEWAMIRLLWVCWRIVGTWINYITFWSHRLQTTIFDMYQIFYYMTWQGRCVDMYNFRSLAHSSFLRGDGFVPLRNDKTPNVVIYSFWYVIQSCFYFKLQYLFYKVCYLYLIKGSFSLRKFDAEIHLN